MNAILENIKFPIGKYLKPEYFSMEMNLNSIEELRNLPIKLKQETAHLSDEQLNTPYREGGWTIRQVIHHLADSHINSYVRIKLALTENNPVIKTYEESLWAETIDARIMPVDSSLALIEGLHLRWAFLLSNLSEENLFRTFYHPESNKEFTIIENAHFYAFHGKHHLAQIKGLKNRMGWE